MKTFLLDTNVLVNDPLSLNKFGENTLLIPLIVVQELDGLKKRSDATGQAARSAARMLDELREEGDLSKGVTLPSGGTLKVLSNRSEPQFEIADQRPTNDHYILQHCIDHPGSILVTEDLYLRIMAASVGVTVERYQNTVIDDISMYEEVRELYVDDDLLDKIYQGEDVIANTPLYENEYVHLRDSNGSALTRFQGGSLSKIRSHSPMKISGRNMEQKFALDALMDPSVELVVLAGKAGTGKTLCAIAAGLEQVIEKNSIYSKLTVARPVIPMGKDIGFLPGTLEEKLDPWMGPIHDNIEFLMPSGKNAPISNIDYLKDKGLLQVEALTYIRGRSLPNQFILVDEAQNLNQHEVKTIITRAGTGTKLVFTGDPFQIDSPYLDQYNNGLSYIIDRFKGEKSFAYVTLHKGERSPLAELAARIL